VCLRAGLTDEASKMTETTEMLLEGKLVWAQGNHILDDGAIW